MTDAEACIGHDNRQYLPIGTLVDDIDGQRNRALVREFDGITKQVQQHLSNPLCIADMTRRDGACNVDVKAQRLALEIGRDEARRRWDGLLL